MRCFLGAFAVAALLIGAPRAADAAVTFDLTGTCSSQCSNIGLSTGDAVSGSFSFNDAAIIAGGTVDEADLLSFALDFGTVHITSATAAGVRLDGTLNATATGFDFFQFNTSEAVSPAFGGAIAWLANEFTAAESGNCLEAACDQTQHPRPAFGLLEITLRQIPEPSTLVLLGAGIAGIAFARRRKRD